MSNRPINLPKHPNTINYGCPNRKWLPTFMEYTKEYPHIRFKVTYSVQGHFPNTLSFAAGPFEEYIYKRQDNDPSAYLLYGKVGEEEHLEVGFRPFTFTMTQDMHSRLGLLYEMVLIEYRRVIGQR